MAELDIGQHCTVAECKQLDFLPVQCDLCGLIYCKDHASYNAHSCSQYSSVSKHDENLLVETRPESFACSFGGCRNHELVEVRCEYCSALFCLVHRHCADHKCPNTPDTSLHQLPKTAEHVRQLLGTNQPAQKKKPVSAKSAAMAAKIALIKIKQKAVGDSAIPESDRVFFNVVLPLSSDKQSMAIFVNRNWPVGKAVDKIAVIADITNSNNVAGAKQLCMFESVTGRICPPSKTVASLLDIDAESSEATTLHNGSTVILEYVDSGVSRLDSLQHYTG